MSLQVLTQLRDSMAQLFKRIAELEAENAEHKKRIERLEQQRQTLTVPRKNAA